MSDVSIIEYLEESLEEIREKCTGCGECVAHCEINPFTALREVDPVRLGRAKLDFLVSGATVQLPGGPGRHPDNTG